MSLGATSSPAADTLHIYNVRGCFGRIGNGDAVTLSGTVAITPAQTITSP